MTHEVTENGKKWLMFDFYSQTLDSFLWTDNKKVDLTPKSLKKQQTKHNWNSLTLNDQTK